MSRKWNQGNTGNDPNANRTETQTPATGVATQSTETGLDQGGADALAEAQAQAEQARTEAEQARKEADERIAAVEAEAERTRKEADERIAKAKAESEALVEAAKDNGGEIEVVGKKYVVAQGRALTHNGTIIEPGERVPGDVTDLERLVKKGVVVKKK